MSIKNNKILKLPAIVAVLSIGLLSGGYTLANKNITLVVKGNEIEISTLKSSVEEVLIEQNIEYDQNDIISAPLNQKISDGDKIEIIDVIEKTITEDKEVPFEVKVIEDNSLLKGDTTVEVEGKSGKNELLYKIIYHNGKQVEKKFIEEVVTTKPVDKVIKKGTKVELQVASSKDKSIRVEKTSYSNNESKANSSTSNSNVKNISVVATAYTDDSITSTGTKPKWGTIAVDPSIIPYGTKVYIPQFDKTFIAEDCGSAIKGNKIDIYMNDEESVKNWGRKTIDICIIG